VAAHGGLWTPDPEGKGDFLKLRGDHETPEVHSKARPHPRLHAGRTRLRYEIAWP
jgi:hypothetical protein